MTVVHKNKNLLNTFHNHLQIRNAHIEAQPMKKLCPSMISNKL